MTKNLLTNSEKPGSLKEPTPDTCNITFDEFCTLYEDDLYIEFMETGAYYEFEQEDWLEERYEEYERSKHQDKTRTN